MIPAFVNSGAGTSDQARRALTDSGAFDVREVKADALCDAITAEVARRAERIVVAGGDGSLGTAARAMVGTQSALGVLPAGTLNHFAGDLGIPDDAEAAARIASEGRVKTIDVARINDVVFLNTSSVGAYVSFVRHRERLEKILGYRLASFVAALTMLFRLQSARVRLEVDGVERSYDTPLVFIGVGERELKLPALGARVAGGRRGLHVMVVRRRSGARVLALAFAAATRGVKSVARTPALDSFIVERCTVDSVTRRVAVDGEIVEMSAPLEYTIDGDALRVVVAPGD